MRWAAVADAGQLGAGDCEALGAGLLAQPANALTSLLYVVVAAVVAAAIGRGGRQLGADTMVFVGALAAIGIGSVAFHGPQPPGSRVAHDLAILAMAWFVAWLNAAKLTARSERPWGWFVVGVVVAGVAVVVAPSVALAATAGIVVLAIGSEVAVRRRAARSGHGASRQRAIDVTLVGGGVLAIAMWWLGRTGSPICDPDTWLQPHAVWHALTAGLLGLWWWSAGILPSEPARIDSTRR